MKLDVVRRGIEECRACPRLVVWREEVARKKRARYAQQKYWGKPVAGFGDPKAKLVIVGLAPGAHGANRTGRVFTGDRSGDFLYAALHRAGLANQSESISKSDGLKLDGVFITLAARCVPPGNKPSPSELSSCKKWLDAELAELPQARVYLALGAIAWHAMVPPRVRFVHGAALPLGERWLVGSYHVSQQNTQTGRLTAEMFDTVLARAMALTTRQIA